jgi:uncharacterized repeat protein (TIGR01451 family)
MRTAAPAFAGLVSICISGCASISDQRVLDVSAAPLKVTVVQIQDAGTATGGKREFLGMVVNDSLQSCSEFLNRLTLEQQTINASGDIATTVFSALATVFTPMSTVHGLTGAATIASGSKTSLMNALYAKASISNFSSALQQTYARDIAKYIVGLDDLDESKIIVSNEVARIRSIHIECTLAQAEATVTSTLATASPAKATPITVSKSFAPTSVAAGHTSTLTVTFGNSSGAPAVLTSTFVDTFPAGMTLAAAPNIGGNCQKQSVRAEPSSGSVGFNSGATIPPSGCSISVAVMTTATGQNVIAADSVQTNQGSNATAASATLTFTAAPGITPTPPPPTNPTPAPSHPARAAASRVPPTWGAPLQSR